MRQDDGLSWWGWAILAAFVAGGVALAVFRPGTLAFWLSPLLVLVALTVAATNVLSPWDEIPRARRRLALIVSWTAAVAATPLLVLVPSERGYLLAALLVMPLLAIVFVREDEREGRSSSAGDPAGDLPDFPGA